MTGTTAFLTNSHVMNRARPLKGAEGHIFALAGLLHGKPVEMFNQAPATIAASAPNPGLYPLTCGEWLGLSIGYWCGIDLLVNP